MVVNIYKFLLISKADFNLLISVTNSNLTENDAVYLITYLFANFMAYVIIYLFIKIVLNLYYQLFSKKDRNVL